MNGLSSDQRAPENAFKEKTFELQYAFALFMRLMPGHSQLLGHFFVYALQNSKHIMEFETIFANANHDWMTKINKAAVLFV